MNELNLVYPGGKEKMRTVVLFSGGASGVKYLFENDGRTGDRYRIVAGLTDNERASGIDVFSSRDVPVEVVQKGDGRGSRNSTGSGEHGFFHLLRDKVNQFDPDLILLSGFMKIVRDPLLSEYDRGIINVHPADLRVEEDGERKYTGDDAVYQSVISGENQLRSTVHFVTRELDQGPIVVLSNELPVNREMVKTLEKYSPDSVRAYIDVLQEWMKWECDGPAIRKALDLIGSGRVAFSQGELKLKREGQFVPGYHKLQEGSVLSSGNGS